MANIREQTMQEQNDELRALLITAMKKIHIHVLHCGTDFEDNVIEVLGLPPHSGIDYAQYWERVDA